MKVIPAHSIEAIKMADNLMNEFIYSEFEFPSCTNISTFGDYQELLACAFGWVSWRSLIEAMKIAHEPVYLDGNEALLDSVVLRLSLCIGYESAQGIIYHFIENSGVGYSAKFRRLLPSLASPWGIIKSRIPISSGIEKVETTSHGGYALDDYRQSDIPKHLALNGRFYERKIECALVELAFPELFPDKQMIALNKLHIFRFSGELKYINVEKCETLGLKATRKVFDREIAVVNYLTLCVLENRMPIAIPEMESPTLQDWVNCLSSALRVNGEWPLGRLRWKRHFLY